MPSPDHRADSGSVFHYEEKKAVGQKKKKKTPAREGMGEATPRFVKRGKRNAGTESCKTGSNSPAGGEASTRRGKVMNLALRGEGVRVKGIGGVGMNDGTGSSPIAESSSPMREGDFLGKGGRRWLRVDTGKTGKSA